MTIALNCIIKNESGVLLRMLNSLYTILDYYVVVDTGSTDNSKNIIKDFFDSKGIKGEIHDHTFIDFEDARGYALEKLKGKADYGFLMDADEELIVNKDFNLEQFKKKISQYDISTMISTNGEMKYGRRNFFKVSKPFYWKGKTHEVLLCDENVKYGEVSEMKIKMCNDGSSWTNQTDKEKHLKNASILEKEVQLNNDPRSIFYLAQSYRDAQEPELAIEWYKKRVENLNGFYEERYYSQFMIGNLYSEIGNDEQAMIEWEKCSQLDPLRAEHLWNMILTLQKKHLWEEAYKISNIAVQKYAYRNPYPKRILFIDENTYSYGLMECHKLNLHFMYNQQVQLSV